MLPSLQSSSAHFVLVAAVTSLGSVAGSVSSAAVVVQLATFELEEWHAVLAVVDDREMVEEQERDWVMTQVEEACEVWWFFLLLSQVECEMFQEGFLVVQIHTCVLLV